MVLKDSSVKSTLSILALLSVTLTIMLMFQPTHANPDDVVEVTNEWNGHTQISNSEYGARKPVIRFSPVSNRALLIYDQWNSIGGNKDPYYALSSDGGASWSAGQSVAVTAVGSSDQAVGLLDYQDAGFAFWVENSPGIASTLVFSRKPLGNAWTSPTSIKTVPINDGLLMDPNATVSSDNTVHLVWTFQDMTAAGQYRTNIYYAARPQGGPWSSPVRINNTLAPSREPAIAVAPDGKLHIVWEEAVDQLKTEIRYSVGAISGGNFVPDPNWNYIKLSPEGITQATLPLISISNNKVQIAYTNLRALEQQNIYFASCTLPCSGFNKDRFASVISYVSVNGSDPFDLVADMAYWSARNSTFIYFHGAENLNANENILGVGSCSGWSGAAIDQVIDPDYTDPYRAIEPSITIKGNTILLAYNRIVSIGGKFNHQVYVTKSEIKCDNFVFLPAILKK